MYKLILLICVSLTLSSVYSDVKLMEPQPIPEKFKGKSGCYNKKIDALLPLNEVYAPNDKSSCQAYYCQGDGYIIAMDCPVVQAPPSCRVTQDLTLPFPDCCKQYDCPSDRRS